MNFQEEIIEKVGAEVYQKLVKRADQEVGCALQMSLVDQYCEEQYYKMRPLLPDFIKEYECFERLNLKISPEDIVNVFFKCKLLYAVDNEKEYRQRAGGGSWVDEVRFVVPWNKKPEGFESLIHEYLERIKANQKERCLVSSLESIHLDAKVQQSFFDNLFEKLKLPFYAFFEEESLISKQAQFSRRSASSVEEAKDFFSWPSIGFATSGSSIYCRWYGIGQLRTFLNLLKVFVYIYPGQRSFGDSAVQIMGPKYPVFLDSGECPAWQWDEDSKVPEMKLPDTCLFNSFGYRGVAKMWLGSRNVSVIESSFLEHRKVLDLMQNPWDIRCIVDINPTLDILNSATQVQDLGAKILLLYCALEHLFVPKNVNKNNASYIIGGINALDRTLISWFDELYHLRCSYAHKGYVLKAEETRSLIEKSFKNVVHLLTLKIST